jgi:hypothetical protein
MKTILLVIALVAVPTCLAQQTGLSISFTPEQEKFAGAAKEYQDIWRAEGSRIIEAMESVSGMKTVEKEIKAIVYEGVSFSGFEERPMKLRASYPADVKKATLIHELGHRFVARVPGTQEIDAHRVLFLILYDIWVKLYGKEFADKSVEVERKRKGLYDYEAAWKWALSLSAEERASKFKELKSRANVAR